MRSFETVSIVFGPGSLPAPRLAVEKAMKMSPEEFPELEPVRARPIVARRASRFSCVGNSGASVATTMMMEPTSALTSGSSIALLGRGVTNGVRGGGELRAPSTIALHQHTDRVAASIRGKHTGSGSVPAFEAV